MPSQTYVICGRRPEKPTLREMESLTKQLDALRGTAEIQSFGLYEPHFDFDTSEEYKDAVKVNRDKQKSATKEGRAAVCTTEWTVEGSKVKGRVDGRGDAAVAPHRTARGCAATWARRALLRVSASGGTLDLMVGKAPTFDFSAPKGLVRGGPGAPRLRLSARGGAHAGYPGTRMATAQGPCSGSGAEIPASSWPRPPRPSTIASADRTASAAAPGTVSTASVVICLTEGRHVHLPSAVPQETVLTHKNRDRWLQQGQ